MVHARSEQRATAINCSSIPLPALSIYCHHGAIAMQTTTRVLVIDDHPFFLEGLKLGLRAIPALECDICTAPSARSALTTHHDFGQFDLMLCDLNLPEINGIDFIECLLDRDVETPVAIISASDDHQDVQRAMSAGAVGYINKGVELGEFARAVQAILAGKRYLPVRYRHNKSAHGRPVGMVTRAEQCRRLGITARQYDVLKLLAEGLSNREISSQLGVKESTIKSHLQVLFQVLNVSNRTACLCRARSLGLLPKLETA